MSKPLAVVTGASSGIGLAVARALAADGHPLLLLARHHEPQAGLDEERCRWMAVDVADYEAFAAAVAQAEAAFGGTDLLVNAAGFADARAFTEADPPRIRAEIETNLIGAMNGMKIVVAGMEARGSGTIVNISSVSDRKTSPVAIAYTASKYGLRAAGESLREAEGMKGVRVVNLAPGYVRTNIHAGMGISFEEYRRLLGNPDFLSAEELAEVVLYCYRLPQHICIRDLVIAPTRSSF